MDGLQKSNYRLIGVSPGIIFHNGQLANPRNKFAKAIKEISGKRKKTDADLEAMGKFEFDGSLYVNETGEPIMPSEGIEAVVRAGAKKSKEGKVAQSGVFCLQNSPLDYDGPRTADELWNYPDEKFVLVAGVKVGQSRVMRTRPIFPEWSCDIKLHYNPEVCNEEQLFAWLQVSGEQCGAFDWRPRYGRFIVERLNEAA